MCFRTYRYIAYRNFTRFIYHRLRKYERKVIPACCIAKIRQSFPSQEYCGFKYARPWVHEMTFYKNYNSIVTVCCIWWLSVLCEAWPMSFYQFIFISMLIAAGQGWWFLVYDSLCILEGNSITFKVLSSFYNCHQ